MTLKELTMEQMADEIKDLRHDVANREQVVLCLKAENERVGTACAEACSAVIHLQQITGTLGETMENTQTALKHAFADLEEFHAFRRGRTDHDLFEGLS